MSKEIYVLATTTVPSRANPSRKEWAYRIEYAPANAKTPFILSEKVGNDFMTGKFSAEHLLCDDWNNHIEHTKSEWLVPYLKRMAAGEKVDKTEILSACQLSNGQQTKLKV